MAECHDKPIKDPPQEGDNSPWHKLVGCLLTTPSVPDNVQRTVDKMNKNPDTLDDKLSLGVTNVAFVNSIESAIANGNMKGVADQMSQLPVSKRGPGDWKNQSKIDDASYAALSVVVEDLKAVGIASQQSFSADRDGKRMQLRLFNDNQDGTIATVTFSTDGPAAAITETGTRALYNLAGSTDEQATERAHSVIKPPVDADPTATLKSIIDGALKNKKS